VLRVLQILQAFRTLQALQALRALQALLLVLALPAPLPAAPLVAVPLVIYCSQSTLKSQETLKLQMKQQISSYVFTSFLFDNICFLHGAWRQSMKYQLSAPAARHNSICTLAAGTRKSPQ
jgi:hypothetical protein